MIKLKRIFSREHSLFYVYMWNESDRFAFEHWLDYDLKNSLFLKPDKNNKVYVLYERKEFQKIREKIARCSRTDKLFLNKLAETLEKNEKIIAPILKRKIKINNIKELKEYYNGIKNWWSSMVILYEIPDLDVPNIVRKQALKLRQLSEKYSDQQDNVFINFWKNKYPEYKKITFLVKPKEVFSISKGKLTKEKIIKIKERKNGYGLLNSRLFLIQELYSRLEKLSLEIEEEKIKKQKEIRGQIVMRGIVRGRVRVIRYKKQIKELKKGEILVTEMTSPDYTPFLNKVSAIITDEGGITCHAAIVSREMKKPCIVGTNIATKVFKNGDFVEVDANKGIIKIIKKKNA